MENSLKKRVKEFVSVDTKDIYEAMVQRQYLKQLREPTLLLEQRYQIYVTSGIIYFSKQMELRVVEVSHEDKQGVLRDIERIRSMIAREATPPAASPEKC